jgi:hypothetical protein
VDKVTLKGNDDEALSDYFLKSNDDEDLNAREKL